MTLIQADNLSKTYDGKSEAVKALNGVTLVIEQGEFAAVVGPSGSGKSTLLSVLGGLNHPTEGKLVVDGIDVYSLPGEQVADFRREYVGFVFQSFQLVPYLTVAENVMLPLAVSTDSDAAQSEKTLAILEQVGLAGKATRLPDELSGGEQERTAIARALVNEPPIILADEPTGNLDSATGEEMMKLFQQLKKSGKTIVMVTHNSDNVRYADRCIKMRDGQLVG